jgi:hypothetical protein
MHHDLDADLHDDQELPMTTADPETLDVETQMRNGARRLMRRFKYLMGEYPVTLPILLRMTPIGTSRQITDQTQLVVEGFPRSGNTFASYAIWHAAGNDFPVSSHVHHLAQLRLATRRGLPTVLVIREPIGTLASYLIAGPHGRPRGVLKEYISYYSGVLPMLPNLLVVDFTDVTSDMGAVIERINNRFGLEIPPFDHTAENAEAVFAAIQRADKLGMGEAGVARPSSERSGDNARHRAELSATELASLTAQAKAIYEQVRQSSTD